MPWLSTFSKAAWPLSNMAAMATSPAKPNPVPAAKRYPAKPVADTLEDHVGVQVATLPKLAVAAAVWHWQVASIGSKAATLSADWILPIVLRDLALTWAIAGGWDFTLYSQWSPFYETMKQHKLNPVYPKPKQFAHDAFWSTVSTVLSSGFEVALLHLWAVGALAVTAVAGDAWWAHVPTLAWLLSMPYWRIVHFYVVHRGMHKWGTKSIPDVGAWLYRWVHSLHHKSRNPTAWSGVSMHPIESSAYYSAMLIPVYYAAHPIVMLYTKIDLTLAALIGHDGFGAPGAASSGHWLHHKMINCNYSENYAPADYLFGTFAADEDDFVRRFGSGAVNEADKTKTH